MRRVGALAYRELQGKGLILLGGLLLGFLPFAIPHLATTGVHTDTEAMDITANVIAVFLGAGLAIFLGHFAIGEDLADGRLGFYFSRPLSGAQIWAAKFLGNLMAIGAATALVVLPVTIAGGGFRRASQWKIPLSLSWLPLPDLSGFELLAGFAVGLALVFSLSHVLGIAFRARSVWLLVDIVAVGVAATAFAYSSRRLILSWAIEAWHWGVAVLALTLAVTLLIVCCLSVTEGRTDLRRATRMIGIAFICAIGPCLLGLEIYSRWVVRVSPQDLVSHSLFTTGLVPATDRHWMILSGNARSRWDYEPYFLWNPDLGDYLHIGDRGFHWPMSEAFSPDGTVAAWLRISLLRNTWSYRLQYADLSRRPPVAASTSIAIDGEPPALLIAPDNRTIAALSEKSIEIFDLPSGTRRASLRLPPPPPGTQGQIPRAHFSNATSLEVFRPLSSVENKRMMSLELFEISVTGRKIASHGTIDVPSGFLFFSTDASARRVLLRGKVSQDLWLCDAGNGSVLRHFVSTPEARIQWGDFLPDGSIAIGEIGPSEARLRIVSADGQGAGRSIALGNGRNFVFGGWPDSDHLFVLVRSRESGPLTEGRLVLANPRTGDVRPVATGLYPAAWRLRWLSSDPARLPEPGSIASLLFYGPNDSLLEYQPPSGTFRTLIAGIGKK